MKNDLKSQLYGRRKSSDNREQLPVENNETRATGRVLEAIKGAGKLFILNFVPPKSNFLESISDLFVSISGLSFVLNKKMGRNPCVLKELEKKLLILILSFKRSQDRICISGANTYRSTFPVRGSHLSHLVSRKCIKIIAVDDVGVMI
jgi:hypothetical protein